MKKYFYRHPVTKKLDWYDVSADDAKAGRTEPRPIVSTAYNLPLGSLAHKVHPHQVEEFRGIAAKHGLTGVHYDNHGNCEFTSRSQRKKWNKIRGMCDNDGGYGD